jgi:hypothetical protein
MQIIEPDECLGKVHIGLIAPGEVIKYDDDYYLIANIAGVVRNEPKEVPVVNLKTGNAVVYPQNTFVTPISCRVHVSSNPHTSWMRRNVAIR